MPLPLIASPALAATSVSLLPSAASPPLSASPTNSLSPPENIPSLAAVAEEIEHPIHVTDFALGSVVESPRTAERQHAESSEVEKQKTSESYFPADADRVTGPGIEITPSSCDTPTSETADEVPDLPYNLSQYGLVHLPPLPSLEQTEWWSESSKSSKQASLLRGRHVHGSESASSRSQSVAGGSESTKYYSVASAEFMPSTIPSDVSSAEGSRGDSLTERSELTSTNDSGWSGAESRQSQLGVPSPVGDEGSDTGSIQELRADGESIAENKSSSGDYVTFRFQHATDEHGNHVVIGREGNLQRCEDEASDPCNFTLSVVNIDAFVFCSAN
jgi:hypothetical protein